MHAKWIGATSFISCIQLSFASSSLMDSLDPFSITFSIVSLIACEELQESFKEFNLHSTQEIVVIEDEITYEREVYYLK